MYHFIFVSQPTPCLFIQQALIHSAIVEYVSMYYVHLCVLREAWLLSLALQHNGCIEQNNHRTSVMHTLWMTSHLM